MPKFPLETALKIRKRLEKLYQKALSEEIQIKYNLDKQKENLENIISEHEFEMNLSKKKGINIIELQMSDNFLNRIKDNINLTENKIDEQNDKVDIKKKELTLATQKKRILEILKDKYNLKVEDKLRKDERKLEDEISQSQNNLKKKKQ